MAIAPRSSGVVEAAWLSPLLGLVLGCGGTGDGGREGVALILDAEADLGVAASFYDLPFPSDLRVDGDGHPRWSAMPRASNDMIFQPLIDLAERRVGWSVLPVAVFRFDAEVAAVSVDDGPRPLGEAFFIDVDPTSRDRGARVAAVAHRLEPDRWVPRGSLALTVAPGQLLTPRTTWAAVVLRALGDSGGAPLAVAPELSRLARGLGHPRLAALHAPLFDTLVTSGIDPTEVAAATVFTTGDAVAEAAALYEEVAAAHDAEIVYLDVDPDDGLAHERFCELHGRVRLPQLQVGEPPFDTLGHFERDEAGRIVVQRVDVVPFVIAIPRTPMPPRGYPLALYAHGTDGLSTQVVDRGPIAEPGGEPAKGLGPAHVLARHGIASVSLALLLGPERAPGARERAYLNLANFGAYPFTWMQALFDTRVLIDALEGRTIPPELLEGCEGVALPDGATAFGLDASRLLVTGQSAGATITAMLGAIEPRARALVPTGQGGYWAQLLATGSRVGGPPELFATILETRARLTPLHPGMSLLEHAWEVAEPLVFADRIARRPLPGQAARHLYLPAVAGDSFHPEPTYDAMAVAYGVELAGEPGWPELGEALDQAGLDARPAYPVSGNRADVDGSPLTLVAAQWEGDGVADPHAVSLQRPELKHQIGCFFSTFLEDGVPTLPAPAPEDAPCARPPP